MFTPTALPRTLRAALRDLSSERAAVRASAARDLCLAALDSGGSDPEVLDGLENLLRDPESYVRAEAALSLGTLEARSRVDIVAALLEDTDSQVRQAAAVSLGRMGGTDALTYLARAFREGVPDVRFQSLLSLCALDPAQGYDACLAALDDEDPWIASEAALQLADLFVARPESPAPLTDATQRARALTRLRTRAENSHGRVALCAALALAALGDDRGRDQLTAFLRDGAGVEPSDDLDELRTEAIERLGSVGGSEARAALEPIAWRLLPSLERAAARAALARLGDPRAINTVLEQLRSPWAARREAAVHLCRAGRVTEAIPTLAAMLSSGRPDPDSVADALATIGGTEARAALERIADRADAREGPRAAARRALARMDRTAAR